MIKQDLEASKSAVKEKKTEQVEELEKKDQKEKYQVYYVDVVEQNILNNILYQYVERDKVLNESPHDDYSSGLITNN